MDADMWAMKSQVSQLEIRMKSLEQFQEKYHKDELKLLQEKWRRYENWQWVILGAYVGVAEVFFFAVLF